MLPSLNSIWHNILIRSIFQYTLGVYTNGIPYYVDSFKLPDTLTGTSTNLVNNAK